ncbi:MAG: DUF1344 domain-containing protein [Ahrensia sp.]
MKRLLIAILAPAFLIVGHAMADDAEGTIASINASNYTMALDDGKTYTLPAEFDISLIGEGMRVALAYDDVNGALMVTDMEQID